jgi:hypothetical protein
MHTNPTKEINHTRRKPMSQALSIGLLKHLERAAFNSMEAESMRTLLGIWKLNPDKAAKHAKEAFRFAEEYERAKERITIVRSVMNQ